MTPDEKPRLAVLPACPIYGLGMSIHGTTALEGTQKVGAAAEILWSGTFPQGTMFASGETGIVVDSRLVDRGRLVVIRTADGRHFRTTHPDTYRLI
jgi:hypothetical protein